MADQPRLLVCSGGPLIDLFAAPLSAAGEVETFDGSQKAETYDLLVLDAGSLSAADFESGATSAKGALDANKPVLVLSPTDQHKSVLAAAGALRHYPNGDSVALLIEPRRDADGTLRFALAEQYAPDAGVGRLTRTEGSGGRGKNDEAEGDVFVVPGRPAPTITEVERFIERVRGSVAALQSGPIEAGTGNGPNNPPANIPASLFDVTPVNLFQPFTAGGGIKSGYTPPPGSLTFEATVYIGVYYDNISFNEPVQWLIIEHSGAFYTGPLEANDSTHIGWSIAMLRIDGQAISSHNLVNRQSAPHNVNNQTTYRNDTSFSVGVAAGTSGLDTTVTYTILSSVSSAISDWSIKQSEPNVWQFAQATPYDGAQTTGLPTAPTGAAGPGGVVGLPAISVGSLAFNTQTVWQHLPATDSSQQVSYDFETYSRFTFSDKTGKSWHAWSWLFTYPFSKTHTINWAAAWPTGS
ncbi:MAG TPA: hypothetical protein VEU30_14920 [Thermoanaerobaculia bacterium]|nr:hypothetical protein [Thermoanaerobaculia bacterium]